MLVYKFVGMSVRGKGFPTKLTNIGPRHTNVILQYLSLVTFKNRRDFRLHPCSRLHNEVQENAT